MTVTSAFVKLLGDSLETKDGKVDTSTALAGKNAVALYFSAHWCPPCRRFTPKFAEWYTNDLKSKGLEVVFVSSDKDDESFKSYFSEMPWLALPYGGREEVSEKKFKVQGIPTVVILDASGEIITKDGVAAISADPTGEQFPWKPKSTKDIFQSAKIIGKNGEAVNFSDATQGKGAIALYFSAHWCPPCREFTPKLAEWYSNDLKAKGLEVIFVSSDRDEESFGSYFAEQPWLALDFACRKEKEQLSSALGVQGIPSLVILDPQDLSVITKDGHVAISKDSQGHNFPWYPKPVFDLAEGPDALEETVCVIALCELVDDSSACAMEAAMEPLAKKFIAAAKDNGEEEPQVAFGIAKSQTEISVQLRKMMSLDLLPPKSHEHELAKQDEGCAESVKVPPRLMIMDLTNGEFVEGPIGDDVVSSVVVEKFVTDFNDGKLEKKALQM